MKQIYTFAITLILLSVTSFAQAQISIPETYFTDRIGTTEEISFFQFAETTEAAGIVAAAGANQTWDFSSFTVTETFSITETYISLPADIPGADLFTASDLAIRVESDSFDTDTGGDFEFYLFQSINNGSLQLDGNFSVGDFDEDGVPDEVVTTFSPPTQDLVFPVDFEDTWDDSSSTVLTFQGQTLPALSAQKSVTTVDGWGTLILPEGTYQALRLRTEISTVDLFSGIESPSFTDYDFFTLDNVFVSIFVGSDGTISDVNYSVFDGGMTSIPVEDEGALPESFFLAQNYPNPFNPSTSISYSLPATSDVTLKVYTINGQEVRTLVQSTQAAGAYQVEFDASELASGLYLYRLETASFSQTRLMSLIK